MINTIARSGSNEDEQIANRRQGRGYPALGLSSKDERTRNAARAAGEVDQRSIAVKDLGLDVSGNARKALSRPSFLHTSLAYGWRVGSHD
jgi:hypothetical protein